MRMNDLDLLFRDHAKYWVANRRGGRADLPVFRTPVVSSGETDATHL